MKPDRLIAAGIGWSSGLAIGLLLLAGCSPGSEESALARADEQENLDAEKPGDPATEGAQEEAVMPAGEANSETQSHRGGESGGVSPGGVAVPVVTPDVSALAAEGIALAQSADAADYERLAALLLDPAWLARLDPKELSLVTGPAGLQIGHVLRNAARRAPSVLDRLAESPLYAEPGSRQIALIAASVEAVNPGKPLVEFWHAQLDPEADELESTVSMLIGNQSKPAVALLEEAFTSEAFDDGLVFWWFRGPLLERRQDGPLLAMAERLLKPGKLSETRRFALVESLFEYRPGDWYVATEKPPEPPKRAKLSDASRRQLGVVADIALRAGLIDPVKRKRIDADLASASP